MAGDENLKVRIPNAEGKYPTGELKSPRFTDDPLVALVFDYHRHKVAEQLKNLKETFPLPPPAAPQRPAMWSWKLNRLTPRGFTKPAMGVIAWYAVLQRKEYTSCWLQEYSRV